MGFVRGASNFLGIMFNKIPFDAEVDVRWDSLKLAIPLKTENDLLLGSHKGCFLSYEQRANKIVSRAAIEKDLSLNHNYQTQNGFFNSKKKFQIKNSHGV